MFVELWKFFKHCVLPEIVVAEDLLNEQFRLPIDKYYEMTGAPTGDMQLALYLKKK